VRSVASLLGLAGLYLVSQCWLYALTPSYLMKFTFGVPPENTDACEAALPRTLHRFIRPTFPIECVAEVNDAVNFNRESIAAFVGNDLFTRQVLDKSFARMFRSWGNQISDSGSDGEITGRAPTAEVSDFQMVDSGRSRAVIDYVKSNSQTLQAPIRLAAHFVGRFNAPYFGDLPVGSIEPRLMQQAQGFVGGFGALLGRVRGLARSQACHATTTPVPNATKPRKPVNHRLIRRSLDS